MKKEKVKEIFGIQPPQKKCSGDSKCPFHGGIPVKNEMFTGKVIKKDISRSATITWNRSKYVPKYERYEVRQSKLRVHNPACIDAQIGQKVIAARTRPLSKTKHHIILGILNEDTENAKDSSTKESAKNVSSEKADD